MNFKTKMVHDSDTLGWFGGAPKHPISHVVSCVLDGSLIDHSHSRIFMKAIQRVCMYMYISISIISLQMYKSTKNMHHAFVIPVENQFYGKSWKATFRKVGPGYSNPQPVYHPVYAQLLGKGCWCQGMLLRSWWGGGWGQGQWYGESWWWVCFQ